jgi:predicted nucleic acid-binding protein
VIFYDAGMLIALARGDKRAWRRYRHARGKNVRPLITAPVLAQAWRGGRSANLGRALKGCRLVPFEPTDAKIVGVLLAAAGTADVVDAHLAYLARRPGSLLLTSDVDDLRRLTEAGGYSTSIVPV